MNRPAGQRGPLRALLVDDHPLVRQALREIISRERDLAVCGEADDRERALAAMAACQPDLAILDLALKNSDGLELIKDIRLRYPGTLILVLSMYDGSHFAERAIRAGANGYVSKQEPPARIMQAVRKVLSGEIYWAEKVASQVASKVARPELETRSLPCDLLSERELQVFELIGTGASAAQIAAAPDFADQAQLRELLAAIEEREKLVALLSSCIDEPEAVHVQIGIEGISAGGGQLTLISAPYAWLDQAQGSIGVLGPMRMHYERAITAVAYVARLFSEAPGRS